MINKIVVTSSSYGSKYFLSKLLYYNDLSKSNKVVSRFTTLFSLYTIYTIYLLIYIYILTTYYLLTYILQYQ